MYLPRNRTSWDEYMLKDISKYKFYDRSQLVRLRGKYTVQTAHCALQNQVNGEDEYGVDWVQGWSDARVYRGLDHFPAAHLTQAPVHQNSIYSFCIEANSKHKWTQFGFAKKL